MNNIKKFCQKSIVHSDVNNNASYNSFCCDSFCYKFRIVTLNSAAKVRKRFGRGLARN